MFEECHWVWVEAFCLSLALLSVVGVIGRTGPRKEVGLLRPGPRAPKLLGTKWYSDVLGHGRTEMATPAMRTTAVLLGFKLDKCAVFSLATNILTSI